jgi:hypothetical protein
MSQMHAIGVARLAWRKTGKGRGCKESSIFATALIRPQARCPRLAFMQMARHRGGALGIVPHQTLRSTIGMPRPGRAGTTFRRSL